MNFHKIHFLQFTPKNISEIDLDIIYANKLISQDYDREFLGIYVDNTLSWEIHIEQSTHILSAASYAMRSVKPFKSQSPMKIVYFGCFHSVINFVSLPWGNAMCIAKILKYNRI
jgi:hypothetical protein